jgi:hypothetical protein
LNRSSNNIPDIKDTLQTMNWNIEKEDI